MAQFGRSRVGRLKAWFHGMEPGREILNWLEPGSPESWKLNLVWIQNGGDRIGRRGLLPFVLAGQTIDRKMYDPIVPLTAESGSDGVVRVSSANLNARYLRLEQGAPRLRAGSGKRRVYEAPNLTVAISTRSPRVALRIVAGCSHSGAHRVRGGRGSRRALQESARR